MFHLLRALALALSVLLVAGCGSSGSEPKAKAKPEVKVLTDAQVNEALLTLENVGSDFKKVPSDDGEDEGGLGCLDKIEDIGKNKATSAEVDYEVDNDFGTPGVYSSVESYKTEAEVEQAFEQFRTFLEDCKTVDVTEEGVTIKLAITTDDAKVDGAAEQVNLKATGQIVAGGASAPVNAEFSAVRLDNHDILVGLFELGERGEKTIGDYTEVAFKRLQAVADGKKPAAETVG